MRHSTRSRARVGALVAAPIAAVLLLGGCAAGSSMPDVAGAPAPAPVIGGSAPEFSAAESDSVGPMVSAPGTIAADRSVITTGWTTILVEDPSVAVDDAIRIVESAGGRIDGRSESTATGYWGGGSSLTIRVPSERLTAVLEELEGLGDVQEVSLTASDVTLQVTDLDARIEAMRASILRLTELLGQSADVSDLVAIETAISDRQAQLESMLAEQRWLADQVSLSTVEVQFVTEPVVEEPEPETFIDGLISGWNAFVGFLGGLLVAIGFVLPWLIPLAIVGILILVIVRIAIGRRSKAVVAATPTATSVTVPKDEAAAPSAPAEQPAAPTEP